MNFFKDVQDAHLSAPNHPYSQRIRTVRAIFHNVGGTMSVQAIHEMHKHDTVHGYSGIAYNIYIAKDGTRYWGRGLDYVGGGVQNSGVTSGMNANSIQIVCDGDFNKEVMSAAQKTALFKTAVEIVKYYNFKSAGQLMGHREVAPGHTDCPGKNFPMAELREYIRTYGQPAITTPIIDESKNISKVLKLGDEGIEVSRLQTVLKVKGYYLDTIDGDFGPNTKIGVIKYQRDHSLTKDGIAGKQTVKSLGLNWTGK